MTVHILRKRKDTTAYIPKGVYINNITEVETRSDEFAFYHKKFGWVVLYGEFKTFIYPSDTINPTCIKVKDNDTFISRINNALEIIKESK